MTRRGAEGAEARDRAALNPSPEEWAQKPGDQVDEGVEREGQSEAVDHERQRLVLFLSGCTWHLKQSERCCRSVKFSHDSWRNVDNFLAVFLVSVQAFATQMEMR